MLQPKNYFGLMPCDNTIREDFPQRYYGAYNYFVHLSLCY